MAVDFIRIASGALFYGRKPTQNDTQSSLRLAPRNTEVDHLSKLGGGHGEHSTVMKKTSANDDGARTTMNTIGRS
jgi:hypothetical protein